MHPSLPGRNLVPSADGYSGPYFVNDSNLWEQDSVIPFDVRQSFRRMGAELQRERGMIPVQLNDGRRVNVPYEDVQLVPVSNRPY